MFKHAQYMKNKYGKVKTHDIIWKTFQSKQSLLKLHGALKSVKIN